MGLCAGMEGVVGPVCRDGGCGGPVCRDGVCGGACVQGWGVWWACVQGWRVWWGLCAGMEGVVGPVCRDGGCGRPVCRDGVCGGPVCRDGGCGGASVQGWERVWWGRLYLLSCVLVVLPTLAVPCCVCVHTLCHTSCCPVDASLLVLSSPTLANAS